VKTTEVEADEEGPVMQTAAPAAEKKEAKAVQADKKKLLGDTIRIEVSRLDKLIKLVSEIVLDRSKMDHRIKDMNLIFNKLRALFDAFRSLQFQSW